jgi:hypothetical protein
VYGDIGQFGDDILREQASRTGEVNEYLEERQEALYHQLETIQSLGCTAAGLADAVQCELRALAGEDKWR